MPRGGQLQLLQKLAALGGRQHTLLLCQEGTSTGCPVKPMHKQLPLPQGRNSTWQEGGSTSSQPRKHTATAQAPAMPGGRQNLPGGDQQVQEVVLQVSGFYFPEEARKVRELPTTVGVAEDIVTDRVSGFYLPKEAIASQLVNIIRQMPTIVGVTEDIAQPVAVGDREEFGDVSSSPGSQHHRFSTRKCGQGSLQKVNFATRT